MSLNSVAASIAVCGIWARWRPCGVPIKTDVCVSVRTHANDSTTDNQIFMKFSTIEICVIFGTYGIGTKFMTYKSSKTQISKFNCTTLGIGLFN